MSDVMPRPGPRRVRVSVRVSEQGLARIDELAGRAGASRSEQIRRMLVIAEQQTRSGVA